MLLDTAGLLGSSRQSNRWASNSDDGSVASSCLTELEILPMFQVDDFGLAKLMNQLSMEASSFYSS